jgi:hypothetical protein
MRLYPATDEEIKASFDEMLSRAVELGIGPSSDLGFDYETERALRRVAKSWPDVPGELIRNARKELQCQFDGTHAAEQRARIASLLDMK